MMELQQKACTLLKEDSRKATKDALRQHKQIELMCNQRKQFLSKTYDEIQVIQEAYKIGLSESNDLSSDPSKKEENIPYAELKTEFKQQEETWNIFPLITVQEDESRIGKGIEKYCSRKCANHASLPELI
ncbi:hypothetical protein DAPPUDRAFT_253382 [Daphnia pulex]|uniref:Uncharacterized protein n=1 Tax=Daphnia pulex TaxID=6669 RepID=E9H4Q0_DAPPU|nr:hypothetical protein DAPPUDRAFT_253382 [Daphnia pulex]|eukprot:EFX73185.1 hypothetical protein DAPPUDRAFT_253382 [Daphnia pulex]